MMLVFLITSAVINNYLHNKYYLHNNYLSVFNNYLQCAGFPPEPRFSSFNTKSVTVFL